MTVSGLALAQPAPAARAKGPLVWLGMDQKELDDAYDQIVFAPNMLQVLKRGERNSELVRDRLGPPMRMAYGPTPIEALDLYPTKTANAPINVFVHGGAWRSGLAKDNAIHAEMFVNAGAHLVVPDFNNVIETAGDLMIMADQIRRSVAWIYKNANSFGGDPEQIYVSGHSSGGHWVGVLLTTDWQKDFGVPPTIIKGGVAGSGLFDSEAGTALRALELRKVHRRHRREPQCPAPSRPVDGTGCPGLRHRGDAGVPAPEPRFR